MDKKQELLQKLKALAEHGVGGEKLNAQRKLSAFMKKYGITDVELDEDKAFPCEFAYKGERQRRLLSQIIYKVKNEKNTVYSFIYTASNRACRSRLGCKVTKTQKLEIEFLFDFYKRLYEQEEAFFFRAFVQKHRLFGQLKESEQPTELSDEEYQRLYMMRQGMSEEQPLKQITGGGNEK